MARKHSVLMAQVNYQYGNNVFMPYSVGSLQAYAETIPETRENFQFQKPLFLRQNPDAVVKQIDAPAIVCFSCYLWNWEYNKVLARTVRAAFPRCLIIFGGTQVPAGHEHQPELVPLGVAGTQLAGGNFFVEHPYVDILVHHEGEEAFAKILLGFLSPQPDYSKIPGLSIRVEGNHTLKTGPAERIKNLSKLPSPYLAGVFDFMLEEQLVLNASQETNRGCPYECTFCDWGGNTFAKLFVIDEARVLEEFKWFSKHQIEYVFNCDANYGIMPRDLELTEKMIRIRERHGGYPRKFRMCTAKNSNEKIFRISKLLNDAGMNKGATLSFQSMDAHTLEVVKRSNIGIDVFSRLMSQYRSAGIPTYTELIMGMPGETYETTKQGVDTLIECAPDSINIYAYVCSVLPNSEMSAPSYARKHEIKWVRMPILLAHSTPELEPLAEYQDVVVETSAMSSTDWRRTYLLYWAVQTFHCLGLLQHIAIVCRKQSGVRYSDFYEQLLGHFADGYDSVIGKQIDRTRSIVTLALTGGRLDRVLPEFGDIYWPLEEASFLELMSEKEKFYEEIRAFLSELTRQSGQPMDNALLDDLILYESSMIKGPADNSEIEVSLRYDLHGYLFNLADPTNHLRQTPLKLRIKTEKQFVGNLNAYAREIVWYGRKGGHFHHINIARELL